MDCVIEIFPDSRGWSVRMEGEAPVASFQSLDQAERRARWMAVRRTVRNLAARVDILDADGVLTGRWLDEGYIETAGAALRAA